jgi:hypothetical protein
MKSRLLIVPVAGLLLVGAAGAVLAQSAAQPAEGGVVPAAASASPAVSDATSRPGERVLADVLDDLVTKGTITEAQRDAILAAVDARRAERRAEAEARRELWRSILEDGQITREELAQLPAGSPLRNLENLLDDGVITRDELRGLGGLGRGFGFGGRGHGPGGGMWGPAATQAPTTGS